MNIVPYRIYISCTEQYSYIRNLQGDLTDVSAKLYTLSVPPDRRWRFQVQIMYSSGCFVFTKCTCNYIGRLVLIDSGHSLHSRRLMKHLWQDVCCTSCKNICSQQLWIHEALVNDDAWNQNIDTVTPKKWKLFENGFTDDNWQFIWAKCYEHLAVLHSTTIEFVFKMKWNDLGILWSYQYYFFQ